MKAFLEQKQLLIYAVDQGFEIGPRESFSPNPESYDPSYHVRFAVEAGLSALAASASFIETGIKGYEGEIPLIVKLNAGTKLNPGEPCQAMIGCINDALRLGAMGVGLTIYPGSRYTNEMNSQAASVIQEAKDKGLLTMIWAYPRGEKFAKGEELSLDAACYSVQMACHLGADLIKVKMPVCAQLDKVTCVKNIVLSAFAGKKKVLFAGGEKKGEADFMDNIRAITDGGGSGFVIGRNFFQRPFADALELVKRIRKSMI